jgi:hypothetical protein
VVKNVDVVCAVADDGVARAAHHND